MRRRVGRVTVELLSQPDFWRQIGVEFTREIGDERWASLHSINVYAWRGQLSLTW